MIVDATVKNSEVKGFDTKVAEHLRPSFEKNMKRLTTNSSLAVSTLATPNKLKRDLLEEGAQELIQT